MELRVGWRLEERIAHFLKSFPAVYIGGPRQSGKTTLVKQLLKTRHPTKYITFDDLQFLSAVIEDPDSF
ncbi:MAG: AAA family ATPase [Gammaproteobacteria bacterium]|nr:AAA family ATPase [Gammaproteobacteria bacterium]